MKKVLLLLSYRKIFETMQNALKETGCKITEEFDSASDADVVVMDSFYLKAGAAEFIKAQNAEARTLFIQLGEKTGRNEIFTSIAIDEVLAVDPAQSPEEMFFIFVDWLKEKGKASFSPAQEFGSGLWVSMLARLGTIA